MNRGLERIKRNFMKDFEPGESMRENCKTNFIVPFFLVKVKSQKWNTTPLNMLRRHILLLLLNRECSVQCNYFVLKRRVHSFHCTFIGLIIKYEFLIMKESFAIWISFV